MKTTISMILTCAVLLGCAQVPSASNAADSLASPQAFAGCSAADTLTTVAAVSRGIGIEKNPLLAGSVNAHHFLPLVLAKVSVVGLFYMVWKQFHDNPPVKAALAGATVITCGVALHNALIFAK